MEKMNFTNMTISQLAAFYNKHSQKPVKKFRDRKTAERRCEELVDTFISNGPRPEMKNSLRLDRTIRCVNTKQKWKNAYQMWRENPDWMTSSQQDRLTAQLYSAAKQGERRRVTINSRTFELVHVQKEREA